jgi:ribosome maturation factor RimP
MDLLRKITDIIEPSLSAMGYAIVQVKLTDGRPRKTLMVMAERTDDVHMSFDDCTEISRTVSALLDVEDPLAFAYNLEVCSPGIDRPLTKLADFTRFAGFEIKCETILPVDGRKRFKGVIQGVSKETIMLAMPEGDVQIPFAHMKTAKLTPPPVVESTRLKKKKAKN